MGFTGFEGRYFVALLLTFCCSSFLWLAGQRYQIRFVKNERLNTTHFVFSGKRIITETKGGLK
jgi:hypothetical protein